MGLCLIKGHLGNIMCLIKGHVTGHVGGMGVMVCLIKGHVGGMVCLIKGTRWRYGVFN